MKSTSDQAMNTAVCVEKICESYRIKLEKLIGVTTVKLNQSYNSIKVH